MAKGRDMQVISQVGEFLVSAELGRRGMFCTPFAKNVPKFDLIATDKGLRNVNIQVKATKMGSKTTSWQESNIRKWLYVEFDDGAKAQKVTGKKPLKNPNMPWVFIMLGENHGEDRFFVLKEEEVQQIFYNIYSNSLQHNNGKRPRNWRSLHCALKIEHLARYEDNWDIILREEK